MRKETLSRTIVGLAVIAGCALLPLSASAYTLWQLGPAPLFISTTHKGNDIQGANHAPYYGWWNTAGTGLCVGSTTGTCQAQGVGSTAGPWKMLASASCSNGVGATSNGGWATNVTYGLGLCTWPAYSTQGVVGIDTSPYGS